MLSGKGVAPFHVVRSHQLEGAVFSDGDQDMLDAEQARRDCLEERFQQRHLHPVGPGPGAERSAISSAVL